MAELVENPDPLTITTHFLRPGIGGEAAVISAEVVKMGRTMSSVRGTLAQLDKPRVEVIAGFGDLSTGPSERELRRPMPEMVPPEHCVPRMHLEQGVDLPILDRVDVRVRPDQAVAGHVDNAAVSGWIRFNDGRDPDVWALALFCDAFPPSVFGLYGYIGWVPTLELTVQIRRRPEPGWILASFETDDLSNGLYVETGSLWDSSGAMVAQVRQLAMLRVDEPELRT